MTIPGYDPDDVEAARLAAVGADAADETAAADAAEVSIAAEAVPERFELRERDDVPEGALSPPIEIVGLEDVAGLEAIRIALSYDPSKLPPGASPTDVAVAVETDAGLERLASEVDLDEARVAATTDEPLSGTWVVAVVDVEE
ncbi:hypothetical protein [Natrononativus amylolyticus]|uniref:hypothetical protein n=1 Tax=Natrononativus amylolyticus TaxID=2963434 RepID=UPI0020CF99B9|nr:hypothetical protein [Natrononativus amylolyticus]